MLLFCPEKHNELHFMYERYYTNKKILLLLIIIIIISVFSFFIYCLIIFLMP